MVGQFFAQSSNLLGRDRAGAVPPVASLVGENVGNLLVGQCFVPWLHHRAAKFLTFDGDWTLQTLQDNHGRTSGAAGCKLGTRQRRILAGNPKTVGLMACLAIGRKNLHAAIARRKFRDLLCALGSASFFHPLRLAAVRVKRVTAKISGVTTEIGAAKKYCQPVNCDQPNREWFGADARFPLLALNGGVHLLHICLLAVIHSLPYAGCRFRSFLVHCALTFRVPAMEPVTLLPARPI